MDIKKIKAIVDLVKQSNIAELEITEGEEKLRITSINNSLPHMPPTQLSYQQHFSIPQDHVVPTQAAQQVILNNEAQASEAITTGERINSPMVGTFYRSSSPSANPFVEVGQAVKVGQVLCIIEAMKLMNQIESEKEGIIKEILVKDGAPVEYGQSLFIID